jgi:chromosome partitioning protein
VESEQDQQSAEEEDLGHEGLDDAALIADYQGDDQYEDDDYVDDHRSGGILDDGPPGAFLPISSGQSGHLPLDSQQLLTRTIAVAMQKGGVGKTTTAVNLGAALAEKGQRVLLIDLDAQGHLTLYMKPPAELEKTIYHLLVEPDTTVTDVVQEARQMGVHYIPADIELAGAENQLINEIGRESILRDKLEPALRRYDFVIIDCPPSLDLIVINALVAADEVLVPLQAEFLALKGMQELLVTMERVKRRLNPRLELTGILPTLYKHRALHSQEVLAAVRQKYGDKVYDFGITDSIRFAETPLAGQSILQYAKESDGAKGYRALAAKVMENHKAV